MALSESGSDRNHSQKKNNNFFPSRSSIQPNAIETSFVASNYLNILSRLHQRDFFPPLFFLDRSIRCDLPLFREEFPIIRIVSRFFRHSSFKFLFPKNFPIRKSIQKHNLRRNWNYYYTIGEKGNLEKGERERERRKTILIGSQRRERRWLAALPGSRWRLWLEGCGERLGVDLFDPRRFK